MKMKISNIDEIEIVRRNCQLQMAEIKPNGFINFTKTWAKLYVKNPEVYPC